MDDVELSAEDRAKIEQMVSDFRINITRLYKLAYLQGMLDRGAEVRRMFANG